MPKYRVGWTTLVRHEEIIEADSFEQLNDIAFNIHLPDVHEVEHTQIEQWEYDYENVEEEGE